MRCDNKSTISLTENSEFHIHTKHINVRHHFIREEIARTTFKIEWVQSSESLAAIMTKSLPRPTFEHFKTKLQLQPPTQG